MIPIMYHWESSHWLTNPCRKLVSLSHLVSGHTLQTCGWELVQRCTLSPHPQSLSLPLPPGVICVDIREHLTLHCILISTYNVIKWYAIFTFYKFANFRRSSVIFMPQPWGVSITNDKHTTVRPNDTALRILPESYERYRDYHQARSSVFWQVYW